jgi:hypothetical protein
MKTELRSKSVIPILILLCTALLAGCFDEILYESETTGSIVGKVVQIDSGAKVRVRQAVPVDSTSIDPADGTFQFDDLPIGNYVLEVEAPDFCIYTMAVVIDGGRVTYIGEISLSKTPGMVSFYSPQDNAEVVLIKGDNSSNLSISIHFSSEMGRESVEQALSISPPVEGTFRWNQYTYQLQHDEYWDTGAGYTHEGAQITTYSHVHSFTFLFSPKDSFPDTTYHVTLSTTACDTAGTSLERPLTFSFSTIQASYSLPSLQSTPYDGQTNVPPICPNGIRITFPRRMDQGSVEEHFTILPDTDPIFIWPEGNQLTIWTGGLLQADTTYTIQINGAAKDLDGEPLGEDFAFSFSTEAVQVVYTNPRNGALFVDPQPEIEFRFNSWMSKASVEDAFRIEPEVSGRFEFMLRKEYYSGGTRWVIEKDRIKFIPSESLSPNAKYTITLDDTAVDSYGSKLTPCALCFITRPE